MTATMTPSQDIQRLIEIMTALRTPETGCPWDLAQNFKTIAPYTIEEAYEVADAIERGDRGDLKDELGDLLLQVVYHARMAEEERSFAFGDVVEAITAKMIRRHPHVFGSAAERAAAAAPGFWDKIKAREKAEKAAARVSPTPHPTWGVGWGEGRPLAPETVAAPHRNPLPAEERGEGILSILANVPAALPALTRAVKLQSKAAHVGFDWPNLAPVFDKLREEMAEFEEVALPADPRSPSPRSFTQRGEGTNRAAIEEEFGDLLFVMANIARHLKIDPEAALRGANQKFTRRFAHIEARLAEQGKSPAQSNLEEMDKLWDEVRVMDKAKG